MTKMTNIFVNTFRTSMGIYNRFLIKDGKTVKYYSVAIAVKNSVGDYCIDQITKEDVKWLKYVGPVAPGEDFIVFDIVGYYGAPHEIIIPLIELEYMDGTKEMVEYKWNNLQIAFF